MPMLRPGCVWNGAAPGNFVPPVGPEIEAEAAAAKAATGAKGAVASKGAVAKTAGVVTKGATANAATTGTKVAAAAGTKAVAAGAKVGAGTIWTGKSLSLGLGLGLGAWGPLIVGAIGAVAVYGYVRSRKAKVVESDDELALHEALVET